MRHHAIRDAWFRNQGFTSCYSFVDAAAFFGISRRQAIRLFSGNGFLVAPKDVIQGIDALLEAHREVEEANQHARRQALIDDLLRKANKVAVQAKSVAAIVVIAMLL